MGITAEHIVLRSLYYLLSTQPEGKTIDTSRYYNGFMSWLTVDHT